MTTTNTYNTQTLTSNTKTGKKGLKQVRLIALLNVEGFTELWKTMSLRVSQVRKSNRLCNPLFVVYLSITRNIYIRFKPA